MVTCHPIRRKRNAKHAFSAEAIEAIKSLYALGHECSCPPEPVYPPFEGDHPDPNDPRFAGYYSAPPDDCPMCEARHEAKIKVHVLCGFIPWEDAKTEYKRMAALAAAAGLDYDAEYHE